MDFRRAFTALPLLMAIAAGPALSQPALDLDAAALTLGVTKQALSDALGDPSQGPAGLPRVGVGFGRNTRGFAKGIGHRDFCFTGPIHRDHQWRGP